MIGSFIIVFREMLEAGLIIGIALAVTRNIPNAKVWLTAGGLAGVAGSIVAALFMGLIAGAFEGRGQELFNAGALGLAVVMLGWHNIWMARHGREMARELMSTGEAIAAGARTVGALALVVGLAVLREGAEVVLFVYGMYAAGAVSLSALAGGGIGGLIAGGLVSALLYFGLLRIPMRYLFQATSWLIAFLAAGMAAQSVAFLEQAGIVTVLSGVLWDSSGILSQSSLLGRVLHALAGYIDRPTGAEFLAWVVTLATIVILARLVNRPSLETRSIPG